MKRIQFSAIALAGAALWTITYVMLGYTFAGNVPQISTLVASFIMTGLAAVVVLIFATRLIFAWRRFETA
jgi:membrane protein DedA with SNARE-associated domain